MDFFSRALHRLVHGLNGFFQCTGHPGAVLQDLAPLGSMSRKQGLTWRHLEQGVNDGRAFDQTFTAVQDQHGDFPHRVVGADGLRVLNGG